MKKKYIIVGMIILSVVFSACDSLWNVQNIPSVELQLDISKYVPAKKDDSSLAPMFSSSLPLFGDDVDFTIEVSLHYERDDKLIDKKEFTHEEMDETATINVIFENIPASMPIYASVKIFDNKATLDPLYFSAKSDATRLLDGLNILETRPNVVFSQYGSGQIQLSYSMSPTYGIVTVYNRDELLKTATDMLGGKEQIERGATIYIKDSWPVIQSIAWDFPGLTLKRHNYQEMVAFPMLELSGNENDSDGNVIRSVIFANITLDGNSEYFVGDPMIEILNSDYIVFYFDSGVTLQNSRTIGAGGAIYAENIHEMHFKGVAQNNFSTDSGGAIHISGINYLNIDNALLQNNEASTDGGAVYLEGVAEKAVFYNSLIQGNSATFNGGGVSAANEVTAIDFYSTSRNNSAREAGGLHLSGGSSSRIEVQFNNLSSIYNNTSEANATDVRLEYCDVYGASLLNTGGSFKLGDGSPADFSYANRVSTILN